MGGVGVEAARLGRGEDQGAHHLHELSARERERERERERKKRRRKEGWGGAEEIQSEVKSPRCRDVEEPEKRCALALFQGELGEFFRRSSPSALDTEWLSVKSEAGRGAEGIDSACISARF